MQYVFDVFKRPTLSISGGEHWPILITESPAHALIGVHSVDSEHHTQSGNLEFR